MDIHPEVSKAAPGVLGAFVAMWRMTDINVWQRIVSFIGGASSARFGTDTVLGYFDSANPSLAAFVVGLFAMAVIAKCFDAIESIKPADIIKSLRKKVGV
jgi:hypothetical protein